MSGKPISVLLFSFISQENPGGGNFIASVLLIRASLWISGFIRRLARSGQRLRFGTGISGFIKLPFLSGATVAGFQP